MEEILRNLNEVEREIVAQAVRDAKTDRKHGVKVIRNHDGSLFSASVHEGVPFGKVLEVFG